MSDLAGLFAQARAVGEQLAALPPVREYFAAHRAAAADKDAQQILREHQAQLARVHRLESEGKPVEVADKHKLRDLELRMAGNDALKRLLRSQVEYVDIMNRVHQALEEPLLRLGGADAAAPAGGADAAGAAPAGPGPNA